MVAAQWGDRIQICPYCGCIGHGYESDTRYMLFTCHLLRTANSGPRRTRIAGRRDFFGRTRDPRQTARVSALPAITPSFTALSPASLFGHECASRILLRHRSLRRNPAGRAGKMALFGKNQFSLHCQYDNSRFRVPPGQMAANGAYASLDNLHQAKPAACGMLPSIRNAAWPFRA